MLCFLVLSFYKIHLKRKPRLGERRTVADIRKEIELTLDETPSSSSSALRQIKELKVPQTSESVQGYRDAKAFMTELGSLHRSMPCVTSNIDPLQTVSPKKDRMTMRKEAEDCRRKEKERKERIRREQQQAIEDQRLKEEREIREKEERVHKILSRNVSSYFPIYRSFQNFPSRACLSLY